MAKDNKKNTPSARQKLLNLARERFPDRTFSDLGAEPVDGAADLDEAIDELMTGYATRQKEYDEKDGKLRDLLMRDPDSAAVIQSWVETGDPRVAIVEIFGDDLGMSDEAKEKYKDQLTGWRERKAANDALVAASEQNWENSLVALDDWGNERGLSLEQKRDIMARLLAVVFNGMENKYGPDDFEMAWHSMNYDNDVAAARAEGEVAGRNAKIEATRRPVGAALPPAAGGQGARTPERTPKPKNANPFAGIK